MTCPTCKGRCCRTAGFSTVHDPPFWSVPPTHVCPDCEDGTYEICGDPEPFTPERSFEEERDDVLAWLRSKTNDPEAWWVAVFDHAAGCIERGEHVGAAKNKSSGAV